MLGIEFLIPTEMQAPIHKPSTWLTTGSVLGAIAASSCCILPLLLFSLGLGGAWLGQLGALAPFQPYFLTATLVLLGLGHYQVWYRAPRVCATDACAERQPGWLIKTLLIMATVLTVVALTFPLFAPLLDA